jgi:TPP-dependent pyruvate/acetoin dehydrogenase alpha subunit
VSSQELHREPGVRADREHAVGFASALKDGDRVVCTYRVHGHVLAAGTPPGALLAEFTGRPTGINGGRAGSMNVVDPELSEFTFSSGA